MRKVALGSTFYDYFTTRAFATGVPTVLAGTPDLSVIEENNATPIDTGVTVDVDHASVVGLNEIEVVATTGNGYEAGKTYQVYIDTGTVGGVSVVGECVGEPFQIETAAELAIREYNEAMFIAHVVATTTGNTTSLINLSDIVPSAATADDLNGEILKIKWVGGTYAGLVLLARIDDYAVTNQLASVTLLDGTALPEALAAGDMIWRDGQFTANVVQISADAAAADNLELFIEGTALGTLPKVNTEEINATAVLGVGTSGNKWRA